MSRPRPPHLLRVDDDPAVFATLFAAARAAGVRVGWLELAPTAPSPVPATLEAAAGEGALRAVAVGGGRVIAVKSLRGAPVPRDLLREHFRGCALVLVRGEVEASALRPAGEVYTVASAVGERRLDAAGLVTRLRRPRPWE